MSLRRRLEPMYYDRVMNQRLLIQVLALNGAVVTGVLRSRELGAPHLGMVDIRFQKCVKLAGPVSCINGETVYLTDDGWTHTDFLRSFEPVETLELGPIPALSAEELATVTVALEMLVECDRDALVESPLGEDALTSDGGTPGDLLLDVPDTYALIAKLRAA